MFVRFLLAGLVLAPSIAAAQAPTDTTTALLPERVRFSLSADLGRTLGDFRDNVDHAAIGLQGAMTVRVDQRGTIGFRVQAQYLNYGWESNRTCLGNNPGCRVEANLVTANGIFSLGVGPELATQAGPVRLYGHALIGTSQFTTTSGLQGGWFGSLIATTENFGDGGFTWSSGVGATMPLALVGRTLIGVDVGVDYHAHGRRRYLIEGGITDLPDGSLELDIKESTASLMTFRVGVSFALLRRPKPNSAETP